MSVLFPFYIFLFPVLVPRSPFPVAVTSYIFTWKVDLRVYSCKARMYLPLVFVFINFVSDCIAGYIISTSWNIRFTNTIIAILLLLLLLLISSSSSSSSLLLQGSCLYHILNKPVKTKQLFLTRPLTCSTVHCLLNRFFGTSQLPIFSLILRFLAQCSVYYLCFVHFFYFHFFLAFQNRALCHIQGLGAYFVSACASNFITNFRKFKEIFNSLTHLPSYITTSLTFKAVGEILWCYQSNGTSLEELLRGAMVRGMLCVGFYKKKFGNFVKFLEFVYICPYKE